MKVLLLAGEESGLLYAEKIAAALRARDPSVEIRGYRDYGFRTADLAVMGFWAVLKRIRFFLRVKRTLQDAIVEWKPDAVMTIDYPGLNLKLAAYAKTRGIRTIHVVCPQVWAWKAGRIPKIEASVDRLCCFFPFEPSLFSPGFATFVGHPLVGDFASGTDAPRRDEGLTLAILPGSRAGEITRILPTLLGAAEELSKRQGAALRFVIPAANVRAMRLIRGLVSKCAAADRMEIRSGGARELLMQEATCAVVASGTATLEAALAGCPTVLVYRVSAFLAWFARRVIKGVKHVGLANVIAEKAGRPCLMPELLQEDLTAANVVDKVETWLADPVARATAQAALADTMRLLRSEGDPVANILACL